MEHLPKLNKYEEAVKSYFDRKIKVRDLDYPSPNIVNRTSVKATAMALLKLHEEMVEGRTIRGQRRSIRSSVINIFGLSPDSALGLRRTDVVGLLGNNDQHELESVVEVTLDRIREAMSSPDPSTGKAMLRMASKRANMGILSGIGNFFGIGGGGGGGGGRRSPKKRKFITRKATATRNTKGVKKQLSYTTQPTLSNPNGRKPKWEYFKKKGVWYRRRID